MEEWMNTKEYFITYSIMINVAQHHGFATYQEIAQAIGLPLKGNYMGNVLGEILGLISKNEIEQGRPMMSAIVIGVTSKPGKGFYDWARDLGLLKEGDDRNAFWQKECEKIYKTWKITYEIAK